MKSIWKFPLIVTDAQLVEMPAGAEILSVQIQGEQPCLWALVDTDAPGELRKIWTFGTGHPFGAAGEYIGTYQMNRGELVFHVFEAMPDPMSDNIQGLLKTIHRGLDEIERQVKEKAAEPEKGATT